jgi:hypothetical protein
VDGAASAVAPPGPAAAAAGHGYELIDSHKNTVPGTADRARPVSGLCQLYTQALAAAPDLRRLAAAWAVHAAGGCGAAPEFCARGGLLCMGCLPK